MVEHDEQARHVAARVQCVNALQRAECRSHRSAVRLARAPDFNSPPHCRNLERV